MKKQDQTVENMIMQAHYLEALEIESKVQKPLAEMERQDFINTITERVSKCTPSFFYVQSPDCKLDDKAMSEMQTLLAECLDVERSISKEQKTGEQQRISIAVSRATAEKDKTIEWLQGALKSTPYILNIIADVLYKASEVFQRAIYAIIRFATEKYKSIFFNDEAADIKNVMQSYGETTEQQKAVGAWLCDYAEYLQPFDEIKHRHTLNEVGDVAEGRYDWKIERGRDGINL